jgi:hypothetical protein
MGGVRNFAKQHNPGVSKACNANLEKKKRATHPKNQPGLLSFFTKQPKGLVPPTVPTPSRVIAYAMESTSTSGPCVVNATPVSASPAPKMPAVDLLTTLEKVIKNLTALPDASESDEITVFAQHVPTDLANDNAWEYFDLMLNRFLGFDRSWRVSPRSYGVGRWVWWP